MKKLILAFLISASAFGQQVDLSSSQQVKNVLRVVNGGIGAETFNQFTLFGNNTGSTAAPTTISMDTLFGSCSGANKALTWNTSTHAFGCNTITPGTGTVTSLTFSAPLTGGTITISGTVGITKADTSTDGYLSSTDWNTFNGKQATISTSSAVTNQYVTGFTSPNTFTRAQPTCGNLSDSSSGCSMSTTAGGDLSGTLPSPTVAKVNGGTPGASCSNQFVRSISSSAIGTCASIAGADLPSPTASALGGVISLPAFFQQIGQTNTGTASAQNTITRYSVLISEPYITVSNIQIDVAVADNSANTYDLVGYGPGCVNGASSIPLAFHTGTLTGSVSFATTGSKLIPLAQTYSFQGGWYCVGSSTTAAAPALKLGISGNTVLVMFANGTTSNGSSLTPSTITAPALSVAAGNTLNLALY